MERRSAARFKLKLRVDILEVDGEPVQVVGKTRDMSSAGVNLTAPVRIERGSQVVYTIRLSESPPPVYIRCNGVVVRTQPRGTAGSHEIVLTMQKYAFLSALKHDQEIETHASIPSAQA